jgi:hypothetical protein
MYKSNKESSGTREMINRENKNIKLVGSLLCETPLYYYNGNKIIVISETDKQGIANAIKKGFKKITEEEKSKLIGINKN